MTNNWVLSQEVDLSYGATSPQVWPSALMLCGDNQAHTWRVTILDRGKPAAITGTVAGYFVRPDGDTVVVQGSLKDSIASVTLPQACYICEGDLHAVLRLYSDNIQLTLSALILPVRRILTDSLIDPGGVIPSLDELLAQIAACEEATQNANKATQTANENESLRMRAESEREQHETSRASAETQRVNAEKLRVQDEQNRVQAEHVRFQAEENRILAEKDRADAESKRIQAEASRTQAENLRKTTEAARIEAEDSRAAAEERRKLALNGFSFAVNPHDGGLDITYTYEEQEG